MNKQVLNSAQHYELQNERQNTISRCKYNLGAVISHITTHQPYQSWE